jgi:hypothetical protein
MKWFPLGYLTNGTAPQHMTSTPLFSRIYVGQSVVFRVVFSLAVCLFSLDFLQCLSFELRFLITSVVSSKFSFQVFCSKYLDENCGMKCFLKKLTKWKYWKGNFLNMKSFFDGNYTYMMIYQYFNNENWE